jgi:hypothetical protein
MASLLWIFDKNSLLDRVSIMKGQIGVKELSAGENAFRKCPYSPAKIDDFTI